MAFMASPAVAGGAAACRGGCRFPTQTRALRTLSVGQAKASPSRALVCEGIQRGATERRIRDRSVTCRSVGDEIDKALAGQEENEVWSHPYTTGIGPLTCFATGVGDNRMVRSWVRETTTCFRTALETL